MAWSSVWPLGTTSVKNNTPTGQANTTYIETTLNVDHFFNIGANEDGHHRWVQMPKNAADVAIAAGMDANLYLKEVSASNARVELFYRNTNNIYQLTPSFKTGTVSVTSTGSYVTVTSVSAHSYGQIYMFTDDDVENMSMAYFKSGAGVVQTYTITTLFSGSSTVGANLKFGNGSESSGLNIRVRRDQGPSATYQYRIVYWGT